MVDPMKDLKKTDLDYVSAREELSVVEETMNSYSCVACPDFVEHVSIKFICTVHVTLSRITPLFS